jgi:ADP-L-glycero-D-manno-heptose 6-epimerase
MILITGAAGFIGSCLASYLAHESQSELLLVDDFSNPQKHKNTEKLQNSRYINRNDLFEWIEQTQPPIEQIFHIGARTDTTEFDTSIFQALNIEYSQRIWNLAVRYQVPLVYASSAATYGAGEQGYDDDHTLISQLKPLNPYGDSKHQFDLWALAQAQQPPFWAGLKFFNVYGANEYHKGRMASVVFHAYQQITKTGEMRLFRSHRSDFADGEQLRDFVYVKDVISVCCFLMQKCPTSGIYNLGSGKARSFLDLTRSVFANLDQEERISFIDTPIDIRDTYQYFTQANMQKLRQAGYTQEFHSLEAGIADYVTQYLRTGAYF